MSPDEWYDFKIWCKRHENFVVWTCAGVAITIIASFMIGGMPAGSKADDQWVWDWFQFILVLGIGSLITFFPLIVTGANRLIYRGRHAAGITREAKLDREVKQLRAAERQARDLQQAEARIRELEEIVDLDPTNPVDIERLRVVQ